MRSSHQITSALMKPRSKSVWMTPAACGALAPRLTVQARHSSAPAVRKVMRSRILYAVSATAWSPGSFRPRLSRNARRSLASRAPALGLDARVGLGAADEVGGRVGLADVRQELVAETLPLGRASHEAGDVDEVHRGGDDRLRVVERDQGVEPRIRHRDHADVGL